MVTNFMQWLEDEFLPYLKEWECSVMNRPGFTPAQRKKMLLSKETLLGLRITGLLLVLLLHVHNINFTLQPIPLWHWCDICFHIQR